MNAREIAWLEPIEAAERLEDRPGLAFLDSAARHDALGRYSYLAAEPFGTFAVEDGQAVWNGETLPGEPLVALRGLLARYRGEVDPTLPPFQGGAIGSFDYEFGWHLDDDGGPTRHGRTVHFGFYDTVVAFDHAERRCWIIATGWPEPTLEGRRRRAEARTATILAALAGAPGRDDPPFQPLLWRPDLSRRAFRDAVARVQHHIRAGDIYQANIAQRFTAAVPPGADAFGLYKRLRDSNPAPLAAFLRRGADAILSSSPEGFLRTRGAIVETRPIKGTARRSPDAGEDAALARALLDSPKDRAENVMIVDLMRNDLSRVCEPASVVVPALCGLESYAGLHHLVSVVAGRLGAGEDTLDLLGAAFPGGSITGAPKRRAMEIIAEIEHRPRGIYCGAIGAIGFNGDLDLSIAIRTVAIAGGEASVHAGAGITLRSDPDGEYEETLLKARRIFEAFAPADLALAAPARAGAPA